MKQMIYALLITLGLTGPVWALEKEPFSLERFETLQSQGEVVLIDIFATWCSTCAKQQKVLKSYLNEHPQADFHILEIDFDKDKKWVKQFRAPRQSTLILYRGDEKLWYSVAETRRDVIFQEINQAVGIQ